STDFEQLQREGARESDGSADGIGAAAVAAGTAESARQVGPPGSIGAAVLNGFCALLTLVCARGRGKAPTRLGISRLPVGAAGCAGPEAGGRYINNALNRTTGDIRQIADVMLDHGKASLHHWLNLTLVAGAALVVIGVLVAMLASLFKKA